MSAAVAHVVVVAFPFASHAVKLFRIARAPAAAAPAATFSLLCTAAQLQEQQKHNKLLEDLRFMEVLDGLSSSSESDGAAAALPPHPKMRLKLFMEAAAAGGLREALERARASVGGARVTCVVGDSFMWMAAKAAAEVEAPWGAVWTGGPSALLAHLRAEALRDDIGDKGTHELMNC
ncbi:hypothetical protein VPH35_006154 [Triticum aestivum]